MGQEIDDCAFCEADFIHFQNQLKQEYAALSDWVACDAFAQDEITAGVELEAWLIDRDFNPAPINTEFLQDLSDPMVVTELSKFNIELNVTPQPLQGKALSKLEEEFSRTWMKCDRKAADFDAHMVMIGILPTVSDGHLTLKNISDVNRYHALNEQVFKARQGRPMDLNIIGREHLQSRHYDLMLEAAATSMQLHLQVDVDKAVRFYNASMVLSAPMVAIAANSPYMFNTDLWDETRIPVFEQAVQVGGYDGAALGPIKRVTFGSDYMHHSFLECFRENLEHYPVLLPTRFDETTNKLPYLRFHNGTIWRWNRPLIGFGENGRPHVRIEHRVMAAGPTAVDMIANAALYYGAVMGLASDFRVVESLIPFAVARDNFYAAARNGLNAHVIWDEGNKLTVRRLILDQLLPLAQRGLEILEIDSGDISRLLGVIERRASSGQNGADWQRRFYSGAGQDMHAMVRRYYAMQQVGEPVHSWDLA